MNEHDLERVSAFMDGELSPSETRHLLSAMKKDAELRRFWESGHRIAAVMQGESMLSGKPDLANRVREAMTAEPLLLAPARSTRRRSLGPLGGLALAASVALLAILATRQSLQDRQPVTLQPIASAPPAQTDSATHLARFSGAPGLTPDHPSGQASSAASTAPGDASRDVALTRMTWNDAGPAVEARLNAYLLNHNEYMIGGVHGMLPYARIVGYGQNN